MCVGRRASELEVGGEGLVHAGVLSQAEAICEGGAASEADGVAAREGA